MDAWINPSTRDYERSTTAVGTLVRDPADGLANAAYLRLATRLGEWFGDTTLGSRLHELQRGKNLPRYEQQAVQYAETALQPLLADGRARSIVVTAIRENDDTLDARLILFIDLVDAVGNRQTFRYPVLVA